MSSQSLLHIATRAALLGGQLRFHDAIDEIERALARGVDADDTADVLVLLGDQYFAFGDLEPAIAAYAEVLERWEPRPSTAQRVHRSLLELHRYVGRLDEAVFHASLLLEQFEHETIHDEQMARRRVQMCEQGEPLLRVVVKAPDSTGSTGSMSLDPTLRALEDADYFVEVDEFDSLPGCEWGHELVWRRNRPYLAASSSVASAGLRALDDRDHPRAIDLFRRAAAIDPLSPRPRYLLANTLAVVNDLDGAVAAWTRADELAPGWVHARQNLSMARAVADGALPLEALQVALTIDDAWCARARRSEEQRIESGLSLAPQCSRLLLVQGLQQSVTDRRRALPTYRRALELARDEHECSRALVALAEHVDDARERRALCEEALQMDGDLTANASARVMLLRAQPPASTTP